MGVNLEDMFESVINTGMHSGDIFNSFFKLPHEGTVSSFAQPPPVLAEDDPGDPLMKVEFYAGPNIKREFKAYQTLKAKGLFKASDLPTKTQSFIIGSMLSSVVKELFISNLDKGVYAMPKTAPPGFGSFPFKKKFDGVEDIPRYSSMSIFDAFSMHFHVHLSIP